MCVKVMASGRDMCDPSPNSGPGRSQTWMTHCSLTRLQMMSSTLKDVEMVNTCMPRYRNTTVSAREGGARMVGWTRRVGRSKRKEKGENVKYHMYMHCLLGSVLTVHGLLY